MIAKSAATPIEIQKRYLMHWRRNSLSWSMVVRAFAGERFREFAGEIHESVDEPRPAGRASDPGCPGPGRQGGNALFIPGAARTA